MCEVRGLGTTATLVRVYFFESLLTKSALTTVVIQPKRIANPTKVSSKLFSKAKVFRITKTTAIDIFIPMLFMMFVCIMSIYQRYEDRDYSKTPN